MENKENKITVHDKWKKGTKGEEKENAFQLLRYKLKKWEHCGWEWEPSGAFSKYGAGGEKSIPRLVNGKC